MKNLIDCIKEGLKITSKTKVERGNVNTIAEFSKRYDCEFISMNSCYTSKKVSEALEYILSLDNIKFAELEKDIHQELQQCLILIKGLVNEKRLETCLLLFKLQIEKIK